MSMRFLLGLVATGLQPEERNDSDTPEEIIAPTVPSIKAEDNYLLLLDGSAVRFHVGMLSISLIVGCAFAGFILYSTWLEGNTFLNYIRNLVIALVCRTFFSILFDGVILLGSIFNVGGGNTLMSFQQISLNLVVAFWLSLTIYIHARVQRNFNSEPTLILYQYGIPGVALFYSFLWIFVFQDQFPNIVWWFVYYHFNHQWIVNSINLLFLLIQLALVVDIGRMMRRTSLDNDSISLLWKISGIMGVLVFLFWLHSGLMFRGVPLRNDTSYVYFFYFVDGLECGLVCLALYFFKNWVLELLNKIASILTGIEDPPTSSMEPNAEVLIPEQDNRGIVTIDSLFMTRESGRWKNAEDQSKDVVYTNVVGPERLERTLELYKRLNIIPQKRVTVVEGEEFYDCHVQPENRKPSENSETLPKWHLRDEAEKFKTEKKTEKMQKRNAFYASKYLILDSKENEFPKYLETRPPASFDSDGLKEESLRPGVLPDEKSFVPNEIVRNWLDKNSEILQKYDKDKIANFRFSLQNGEFFRKYSDSKVSKIKSVMKTATGTKGHIRRQNSAPEKVPSKSDDSLPANIPILDRQKVPAAEEGLHNDIIQEVENFKTAERKTSAPSGESELGKIDREKKLEETTEGHDVKDQTLPQQSFTFLDSIFDTIHTLISSTVTRKEFSDEKVSPETVETETESRSQAENEVVQNVEQETLERNTNKETPKKNVEHQLLLPKAQEEFQDEDKLQTHSRNGTTSPTEQSNTPTETTFQSNEHHELKIKKDSEEHAKGIELNQNSQDGTPQEIPESQLHFKDTVLKVSEKEKDTSLESVVSQQQVKDTILEVPEEKELGEDSTLEGMEKDSLCDYLTYSELLEFRSKRDKQANEKLLPPPNSNNVLLTLRSMFNYATDFPSLRKFLVGSDQPKTFDFHDLLDERPRFESKKIVVDKKEFESHPEAEEPESTSQLVQFPTKPDEKSTIQQDVALSKQQELKELFKPTEEKSPADQTHKNENSTPLLEHQSDPEPEDRQQTEEAVPHRQTTDQPKTESKRLDVIRQKETEEQVVVEDRKPQTPAPPAGRRFPLTVSDETPKAKTVQKPRECQSQFQRIHTRLSSSANSDISENEKSSDSEFSIEKRKSSISSCESFSVEQYYESLLANRAKFISHYN